MENQRLAHRLVEAEVSMQTLPFAGVFHCLSSLIHCLSLVFSLHFYATTLPFACVCPLPVFAKTLPYACVFHCLSSLKHCLSLLCCSVKSPISSWCASQCKGSVFPCRAPALPCIPLPFIAVPLPCFAHPCLSFRQAFDPGGSACCYSDRYGTQCNHPTPGVSVYCPWALAGG